MKDPNKETDPFVDELWDASLARYRSYEPRPGLETRVLAGVRAKGRAGRRRVWALALAGTAAAMAFIVGAVIYVARPPPAPAPLAATRPAPFSKGAQEVGLPPKPVQHDRRSRVAVLRDLQPSGRARSVPRRPEQFPTPAPLSEQEKLLLLYVNSVPAQEMAVDREKEAIEPLIIPELKIAALEIKPLSLSDDGHQE